MENIRSALGNGIDGTSRETALTDIKRCDVHLNLLNRLHGNRLGTGLTAVGTVGSKTEDIVVGRTVNHEGIVTVARSGERHGTVVGGRQLRIEACHIGNTVSDARHIGNLLGTKARCRSCLRSIDTGTSCHDNFLKFLGVVLKRAGEFFRLAEAERHVLKRLRLLADVSDRHLVRTTHTHALDGVAAVNVRHSPVDCSRWHMGRRNGSPDDILALRRYLAADS